MMSKTPGFHLAAILYFTICLIHGVAGYSTGAPFSTCMTMFPKHGMDLTWQESGVCPFQMKLSKPTYRPNENITLTVEADDGQMLMGIQISAHRKSVNTEDFIGTFVSQFPEEKLQVFSCQGGRHNQVSHKNNKTVDRVVLVWQSPAENVGDIIFKATFVQSYKIFWAWETAELKSDDPTSVVLPAYVEEQPSVGMTDIDFSGCGTNKGCFLYPRYCTGDDCDVALTYRFEDSRFVFEMSARAPGYVTVGISKDKLMGNDQTVTCTARDEAVTVQNGNNPAYFNERVLARNLTEMSVKKTESHVMCTFSRPRIIGVTMVKPGTDPPEVNIVNYDLSETWHLMMSWGHIPAGTDVMGKHVEMPVVSDNMVDFTTYTVHRGAALLTEFRAHGSLMVIAWILLSGIVTVIARYYKDICPATTLLGTKVWFQTHRGIAFTVIIFTAISFIIVFNTTLNHPKYGWSDHGKVGIAVGVAVLLQVLAGLLRPGADSNIRPWFNWGHRLFGLAVQILAAANIYLAFMMKFTPMTMSRFGGITVLVWVAMETLWFLVLECWACRRRTIQGTGAISDPKGMSMEDTRASSTTRTDYILLILYILTLITFSVAVLCAILLF